MTKPNRTSSGISRTRHRGRVLAAGGLVLATLSSVVVGAGAGAASVSPLVQQVSSDPLTAIPTYPPGAHHATELETAVLAEGNTVVSSFQVGRFAAYGAMAMGWATSTDGGHTWQSGLLPGVSASSPSPNPSFIGIANQSVMYDAATQTWIIPSVAVVSCASLVPTPESCIGTGATEHSIVVNRSSDGVTWGLPVVATATNADKPWGTCDNTPTSPHFGTCYIAYAQIDDGDRLAVIHSTDGGATWSAPVTTPSDEIAYNAVPVVQPDGRLVVVATDINNGANGSRLLSFVSDDGGETLGDAATGTGALPAIEYHTPAGGIRAKNKPSVAIDVAGVVYVAWSDCRFRAGCAENDIVFAKSLDGIHFTSPIRVAADPTSSTIDHFIPGIAVRPGTSGDTSEVGVVYYAFPSANCTATTCQLDVDFSSSSNGGMTWQTTQLNATSMKIGWLAPTTLGPSVGDYEGVTYTGGDAVTVFPDASAPIGGTLNESEYAATFPWEGGTSLDTTAGSGQYAPLHVAFAAPLQALALVPTTGASLAGATVTFTLPASGASGTFPGGALTAKVTTGPNGIATAPTITANGIPGRFAVAATTAGGVGHYLLTNSGAPSTVTVDVGSSPQGAPAGSSLPTPLAVTVRDAGGSPVAGVPVTFSAPTAGASGTFATSPPNTVAVVTTGAGGAAAAPGFTTNTVTGSYVVSVTAGAAHATIAVTNTSGVPASLTISGASSQAAVVGTSFGAPLSVKVTDSAGQLYPDAAVTFTAPSTSASATFVGSGAATTTVMSNGAGIATVPVAYASSVPGSYSVVASAGSATAKFALTNDVGPATYLIVWAKTNNQSQTVGSAFPLQMSVTVLDRLRNPVPNDPVTFAAPGSGASGTFAGTSTSATVTTNTSGFAFAPTFTADATGGMYSVTVSAASSAGTPIIKAFTMTNLQPPMFTSASSTTLSSNSAGSFAVTTSAYPAATVTESGPLPTGVSFASTGNGTATISGTPTQSGVYPVTFTASNGVGTAAQQSFTLTVS